MSCLVSLGFRSPLWRGILGSAACGISPLPASQIPQATGIHSKLLQPEACWPCGNSPWFLHWCWVTHLGEKKTMCVGGREVMGWFPALGKQPVKVCTHLGGAFLGKSSTGSSIQLRPSLQGCLCGSPEGLAEPVSLGATWAIATSTLKQRQTRGSDAPASVDGLRAWLSPRPCGHQEKP